ncbi:amidohydrolase family protein [Nocardia sp. NPDC050630]|uniref:amidohydrolase family protein n=1 Tax=Nocardia sp. NPDC050630 TaxID=3364321 RepID=UPI0037B17BE0
MRPTAAIPVTDVPDAVAEIERCARAGLGTILLPELPPVLCWSRHYDPIWAAAQANGMPVFFHVVTGGVRSTRNLGTAVTVKGPMMAVNIGKGQLTDDMVAGPTMRVGNTASAIPQGIIADLVGAGVCERIPNLHFDLVECSAGWPVSSLGVMDRSWRSGTGQDPDWWLGTTPAHRRISRPWDGCNAKCHGR